MKKSVLKMVEKRKEQWKNASKAERKILLAKDVLAQLRAKKIKTTTGEWLTFNVGGTKWDKKEEEICNLQVDFLNKNIENCECCALGGLMLSCTLYQNKVNVPVSFGWYGSRLLEVNFNGLKEHDKIAKKQLSNIFSLTELKLIESYYECGNGLYGRLGKEFSDFWYDLTSEERMIAIMKNIIKNGKFIPEKKWIE